MYHFFIVVEAIKKVTEIQKRRQSTYVMQRLRKGREVEQHRDIREVQRDMALIRSPAAGTIKTSKIDNFKSSLCFVILNKASFKSK